MANGNLLQPLPISAFTSESSAAGTDPSYLGTDFIGMAWTSVNTTATWITVDLGSAQYVDTVAFLSCLASAATTIRIRGATSLANTTSAPGFDSGVLTMFSGATPTTGLTNSWNVITGSTFQYWRVDFASLTGATFSAGRLCIGQKFTPAIGFGFGGSRGVVDLSTVEFSPEGALFKRLGKRMRTLALTFPLIRGLEIETQLRPVMEKIGQSDMILVTTKTAGDTYFQSGMYYGVLTADMALTWAISNGYSAVINIKSVI